MVNVPRLLSVLVVGTLALAPCPVGAQGGAFHHVHPNVSDTRAAAAWYGIHFGADEVAITAGFETAVFGETLVRFREGAPRPRSPLASIDHIGFSVLDVDATLAAVTGAGATVVRESNELQGIRFAFIEDPWGHKVELLADPDLIGFHHLHLNAADPKAMVGWYADVFGGVPERFVEVLDAVRFPADSERKTAGSEMWLIVTPNPSSGLPDTSGIDHVSWSFPEADYGAVFERIKALGIPILVGPQPSVGDWGNDIMFIEAPGGVRIEITELIEK